MVSKPSVWQKFWWRLTPLGRVQLALASVHGSTDPSRSRARLRSALTILNHPSRAARPKSALLLPLVLEQLIELALRQNDLSEAAESLSQLDKTSIAGEVRLELRWQLIQSLIRSAQRDAVLDQAKIFVADMHSTSDQVAELLRWSLNNAESSQAFELAKIVSLHLQTDDLIKTLRMFCLAPEQFTDNDLALKIAADTRPALLSNWPVLQCKAHLLRARCAESAQDWQQMFQETQAALALMPDASETRYWFARSLLHRGQNCDAEAELLRPPKDGITPQWQRLLQIARLSSQPDLERVEPCLHALEGEWGKLSMAEMVLALAALEKSMRPSIDDRPDRLAHIAELSARAMRVAGELKWIKYNFAVKQICVDHNFEQARAHLLDPVASPPRGCPVHLFRMICAMALGQVDELANAVNDPAPLPGEFTNDKLFFSAVLEVFSALHSGGEFVNVDSLRRRLSQSSDQLSRALPLLAAVGVLLQKLLALSSGNIEEVGEGLTFEQFEGVIWAQWLWQKLWMAQTSIAQLTEALSQQDSVDLHPALLWERMVWRQEFSAVISPIQQTEIIARLDMFKERFSIPERSIWNRLLSLRRKLVIPIASAGRLVSPAEKNISISPCPWLPLDSPFQKLAQREGQVELFYLEGRYALRALYPNQALQWFSQTQDLMTETDLTSALISSRFKTILDYWTGVALAHLGHMEKASRKLEECLSRAKEIEALAQLGLIAFACGDTDAAMAYLERIPQPWPASGHYLVALVAEHKGKVEQACSYLKEIEKTKALNAGVYAAAAHRLEGVMAERAGDYPTALEQYRSALSVWLSDAASVVRLARVWLHESYQRICQGKAIVAEPALNECWTTIGSIGYANLLPLLRNWILASAENLENLPLQDLLKSLDASPSFEAVKRLALRVLLANQQAKRAKKVAQHWIRDGTSDPYLVAAEAILSNADDLIALWNGEIRADRKRIEKLATRLTHLQAQLPSDPAIAFWHDVARIVLNPNLIAEEKVFASAIAKEDRPMPQRAFASVVNLFSGISEQRERAASICEQLIATGFFADESTTSAVSCLVALVSSNDEEFLKHFRVIETDLSVLPGDEAELYVAASQARLRVGAIDDITHGIIPDSLAELLHPEVRRVVGLAYAQRAVRNAEKDVRSALNDLDQAIELLNLTEAM